MKHINTFQIFENERKFGHLFEKGSAPAGWGDWFHGLITGLQNNFDNFDSYYTQNIAMKDIHGRPIDTGFGWLVGTAGSLATGIASKLFEPGKLFTKETAPKDDASITPQHKRLFNDQFVQNDLPKMNSDADFQKWATDQYKKAGVKPGQDKTVDGLVGNASKSFFGKSRGLTAGTEAVGTAGETSLLGTAGEVALAATTGI